MSVEDLVRAATRAEAATMRELRPLRLDSAQGRRSPGFLVHPPRLARGRKAWVAPVTAAAAVTALAISLVTIRDIPNGGEAPANTPVTAIRGVPRYYVAIDARHDLVVGDTFTGARLATMPPPAGTDFAAVTAAADDRTFVVETASGGAANIFNPRQWYVLRVAPGTTDPARLTRLPLAVPSGAGIAGAALSGSGRELAVATVRDEGKPSQTSQVAIYSAATGRLLHAWSAHRKSVVLPGGADFGELDTELTWVAHDSGIVFSVDGDTIRDLDVSAGGDDLIGDSRVTWWSLSPGPPCSPVPLLIAADGKTFICTRTNIDTAGESRLRFTMTLQAYGPVQVNKSGTLGQITAYGPRSAVASINALWSSAYGRVVIGEWHLEGISKPTVHFGVITQGKFLPLPTPPGVGPPTPGTMWPSTTVTW